MRHTVWCDEFPARCGQTRVLQTRIIKAARHLLARLPSLRNALQVVPLASDDSGTLKRRHFFFFALSRKPSERVLLICGRPLLLASLTRCQRTAAEPRTTSQHERWNGKVNLSRAAADDTLSMLTTPRVVSSVVCFFFSHPCVPFRCDTWSSDTCERKRKTASLRLFLYLAALPELNNE